MRKFWLIGLAAALGAAVLLIPAAGGADVPGNASYGGRIDDLSIANVTIICPVGATTGSPKGSHTISVVTPGLSNTGPSAKTIVASASGGSGTQEFTLLPQSQALTLKFPCSGTPAVSTVTFQPKKQNGDNTSGSTSSVTVNLTRVAS